MSAIPAIIAIAAIIVGLLVLVSRRSQPGLGWGAAAMPLTAAVILGVAAYVMAGSPQQMGAPVVTRDHAGFGEELEDPRQGMAERFGPAAQWLGMSDGLLRTGRTESAAQLLQQGLRRYPRNVDLWVGYGNALVAHAGGAMTPAAAMAFDRAAAIDPTHPAPPFFAGLSLAQDGDLVGARSVWEDLLTRTPADAPWREDLMARLAALPREAAPGPAPR